MASYTTQMDAARKGIVTPQMETVAPNTEWGWAPDGYRAKSTSGSPVSTTTQARG